MNRFRALGAYGHSASATIVAKLAFYGSTFIALWLATQILAKADYGSYALPVAVMWFASVPVSLGLDQTVLVRIARRTAGSGDPGLVSAALLSALTVGAALAVGLAVVARPLAQLLGIAGTRGPCLRAETHRPAVPTPLTSRPVFGEPAAAVGRLQSQAGPFRFHVACDLATGPHAETWNTHHKYLSGSFGPAIRSNLTSRRATSYL